MRKKIHTANEEVRNIGFLIFFSVLWYSQLFGMIAAGGFHATLLIFLLAGLLPLGGAVRMVQKAMYYRNLHRQIVSEGRVQRGRIVNIMREYYDEYSSSNRRRRTAYYFLTVEVMNPDTGIVQEIKSEPYRIPIHKYLGSDDVLVYTDQSGWKHVIDGFQLKEHRNDPDISLRNSNVYLKDFSQPPAFMKWIFLIIFALMLLQVIGVIR